MKNILLLIMGMSCSLISMEPQEGHKDKSKARVSASSNSSSDSNGHAAGLEVIDLHHEGSSTVDKERLKQLGKIVISDIADIAALEEALKQKGSQVDQQDKRKSIIYMPQLDLATMTRDFSSGSVYKGPNIDLEKGSSEDLEKQAMEEAFEFFVHYMKDKSQNPDLELKAIKKDLIKKFKKAHNSPPSTPNDTANTKVKKLQKRKQGVMALRKGSAYQLTARAKRAELPQSPALNRARDPKPLEIITSLMNEPEVQEGLQSVEQLVVNLLAEKNKQTQSSLTNTRYGGVLATLISASASALITYLSTKKSC